MSKSYKWRYNWSIGVCLRDCANKGVECELCIRFSKYVPRDVSDKSVRDQGSDNSDTGV